MSDRQSRRGWTGPRLAAAVPAIAMLAIALLVAGCSAFGAGDEEDDAAAAAGRSYLTAWARGDLAGAAARTDRPADAQRALTEVRDRLGVTKVSTDPGELSRAEGGDRSLAYQATLTVAGLGEWAYAGRLPLPEPTGEDPWRVAFSPAAVHPRLTADTRLGRARSLPPRAPILDRDGGELMAPRPVVDVGVEARRLSAPAVAYAALAGVGVDPGGLARRVATARPDEFVLAITLRAADFVRAEQRLRAAPGLVFREGMATLAPTPTFGRALLGAVRPATKETLASAGPLAAASDRVGAGGLQQAYERQLAGTPSGEVRLVSRADGTNRGVLHTFRGTPGRPLRTTLSTSMQTTAEAALARVPTPAAVVAVRPSSGEVLAVANAPPSSSYDRSLVGRYPPGSTFKVVTAAALLESGLRPDATVPCPGTITVEGKRFENYDGLRPLGAATFRAAFLHSCNTAFIGASGDLPDAAIPRAAAELGVGGSWAIGIDAFSGSVPAPGGAVDKAAAAIGQGRVLTSPLAMAMVAAGVASGTPRAPALLPAAAPSRVLGKLDPAVAGTLRTFMTQTVTSGTATVLRLPGAAVGAKTGTAEYGSTDPPRKHAWMIGFRGDLAFAVLVEDGRSGSETAGPIARQFLSAVP
jgi:cell division protein FtsI/penicillin-binding protein 2